LGYLLDTNACIHAINWKGSAVGQRILTIPAIQIYLCTVVYTELCYGAYRSAQVERNLARLETFCKPFACLPLDLPSAKLAGQIRANLAVEGTPIGSNDVLIAAIALANHLTLVTHNTGEFSRVEGLNYEDWE
jgi:tRNA(fMet)-specific endonuclease VapC